MIIAAPNSTTIVIVLTAIMSTGTLAGVAALWLLPAQRAKLGAEREAIEVASDVSLAGGYGDLVTALREDRTNLREDRVALRLEVARLEDKVDGLENKVSHLNEQLVMSLAVNARLDETVELGRRESEAQRREMAALQIALTEFTRTINGEVVE